MIRLHCSELTPCPSHYQWWILQAELPGFTTLTQWPVTRIQNIRSLAKSHWIFVSITETLQIGAEPSSSSNNLQVLGVQYNLQYFSLHIFPLLLRGVQDSGLWAVLAWRIINQYWEERLRREMFCRNFSSAVASWVAERLLSPLPVIHHSDNEKFKYPKQSAGPRTRELFPMVMMARVSGSSESNRLSCLIKSVHQSFVNILIKSNLNRASQAGGDVTITSDTAIHHPGHPHTRHIITSH